MTFRPWIVGLVVLLFLGGCERKDRYDALAYTGSTGEVQQMRLAEPAPEEPAALRVGGAPQRKLVKTVTLELLVADPEEAAEEVQGIVGSVEGHVASIKAWKPDELFHYQIALRVPVERLDEAVRRIKGIADEVVSESLESRDVTEQVTDLGARRRTLRATETELRGLLAESRQRDFDAEDVMAVYERLTEIRAEIERAEGQLQGIEGLATLSSVNLSLLPTESARPMVVEGWRPRETARRSVRLLLGLLRHVGDLAILFAIVILPLTLLAGAVLWPLGHLVLRARRNAAATGQALR